MGTQRTQEKSVFIVITSNKINYNNIMLNVQPSIQLRVILHYYYFILFTYKVNW